MKKFISTLVLLSIFFSILTINVFCLESSNANNKIAYITFDDGPNKNTSKILDILKEYNMKATFFLLEDRINTYPEIVKRMLSEGHSIGLHGQSHEKTVFYANDYSALNEMNNTNHTLKHLFGCNIKLIRVPYGSKPHLTKAQYNSLVNNGYRVWDWNIDSTDTHKGANVTSIVSNTLKDLNNYSTPIILFHDKQVTVESLPYILSNLKENNFSCIPIDQDQLPMNWWNKAVY